MQIDQEELGLELEYARASVAEYDSLPEYMDSLGVDPDAVFEVVKRMEDRWPVVPAFLKDGPEAVDYWRLMNTSQLLLGVCVGMRLANRQKAPGSA